MPDGVFETVRTYGGRPFRLGAHLDRLCDGLLRLGLAPEREALARVAEEALEEAGGGALRIFAVRPEDTGAGSPGSPGPAGSTGRRALVRATWTPWAPDPRWYEHGLCGVIVANRLNERGPAAGLKTLAHLESVRARREAAAADAGASTPPGATCEDILLNTRDEVAEGTASNLFALVAGVLRTPPLSSGALPGITRGAVLELAGSRHVETDAETPLLPGDLRTADEAFLTSSLREVVPLVRLDGRPIGSGEPGPVTLGMLAGYRVVVEAEVGDGPRAP